MKIVTTLPKSHTLKYADEAIEEILSQLNEDNTRMLPVFLNEDGEVKTGESGELSIDVTKIIGQVKPKTAEYKDGNIVCEIELFNRIKNKKTEEQLNEEFRFSQCLLGKIENDTIIKEGCQTLGIEVIMK